MESQLYAASAAASVNTALQDAYAFLKVPPSISGHTVELPTLMSHEDFTAATKSMRTTQTGRMALEGLGMGGDRSAVSPSGYVSIGGMHDIPSKKDLLDYSHADRRSPARHTGNSRSGRPGGAKGVPSVYFGLRVLRDASRKDGEDNDAKEDDDEGGDADMTEEEKQMAGGGGDGHEPTSTPPPPPPEIKSNPVYTHPRKGLLEKRIALQSASPSSALDAVFLYADLRLMPSLGSLANERLYVRALDALSERDLSIKRTKAKMEEDVAKHCPFRPIISDYAKTIRADQTVSDFFPKGKEWKEKVAKKLNKMIEKEDMERAEEDLITFAPWKMDPQSVAILQQARNALKAAEKDGVVEAGTLRTLDTSRRNTPLSSNARCPADLMSRVRGDHDSAIKKQRAKEKESPSRDFHASSASNKYFLEKSGGIYTPFLVRLEEDLDDRDERRLERAYEREERESGALNEFVIYRQEHQVYLSPEEIEGYAKVLHSGRCTDADLQRKRRKEAMKLLRKQQAEKNLLDERRAEEVAASNGTFERLVAEDPDKYRHLGSTLRSPSRVIPRVGTPAPREALPINKKHLHESPAFIRVMLDADKELTFAPECDHAYYAGSEMELYNKRLAYERALKLRKKKKKEQKMEALGYIRLEGDTWVHPGRRALSPEEQSQNVTRLQLSARHQTTPKRTRNGGVEQLDDDDDAIHAKKVAKWEAICQERRDKEMGECTFSPRISAASKKLVQDRFGGGVDGSAEDGIMKELGSLKKDQKRLARAEKATAALRAATPHQPATHQRTSTPSGCLSRPRAGPRTPRSNTPNSTLCRWKSPATTARQNGIRDAEADAVRIQESAARDASRRELMQRRLQTDGKLPITEEDRDRYRREAEAAISGGALSPINPNNNNQLSSPQNASSFMLTGEPFTRRINPANYTTSTSTTLALYRSAAYGEPLSPEAFQQQQGKGASESIGGRQGLLSPYTRSGGSLFDTTATTTPTRQKQDRHYRDGSSTLPMDDASPRTLEMRVKGSKEALAALRAELSGHHNTHHQSTIQVPRRHSTSQCYSTALSSNRTATPLTAADYDAMSIDEFLVTILTDQDEGEQQPTSRSATTNDHTKARHPHHKHHRTNSDQLVSSSLSFNMSQVGSTMTPPPRGDRGGSDPRPMYSGVESTVKDLSRWFGHLGRIQRDLMGGVAVDVGTSSGAARYLEGCLPPNVMNSLFLPSDQNDAQNRDDDLDEEYNDEEDDLLAGFDDMFDDEDRPPLLPKKPTAPTTRVLSQLAYVAMFEAMKFDRLSEHINMDAPSTPDHRGVSHNSRSMSPLIWKRSPSRATTMAPGPGTEEEAVLPTSVVVRTLSATSSTSASKVKAATAEVRSLMPPWPEVASKFPDRLSLPLFIALFQYLYKVDL